MFKRNANVLIVWCGCCLIAAGCMMLTHGCGTTPATGGGDNTLAEAKTLAKNECQELSTEEFNAVYKLYYDLVLLVKKEGISKTEFLNYLDTITCEEMIANSSPDAPMTEDDCDCVYYLFRAAAEQAW